MSVDFKKTGIVDATIQDEYKTLPDGSMWLLILYHNNKNGTKYFTSSNAMNTQEDFDLYSRLYMIPNYKSTDNYYEFMAIQPDNGNKLYRWKQTSNPLESTTCSGFVKLSNDGPTYGIKKNNNQAVMSADDDGWWQATGCWTNCNNAVPGYGIRDTDEAIVKGILMLYIRIDNTSHNDCKVFSNEVDASWFSEV